MKTIISTIAALITMTSAALAQDLTAARYKTEVLCAEGQCGPGHEKMIERAKERFANLLREPSSAEFTDVKLTTGKDMKSLTVCGLVKARNGFGGMTGYKRFFITEAGDFMILSDGKDALRPHWHYHCDPEGWR